jgi:hypothetical protein
MYFAEPIPEDKPPAYVGAHRQQWLVLQAPAHRLQPGHLLRLRQRAPRMQQSRARGDTTYPPVSSMCARFRLRSEFGSLGRRRLAPTNRPGQALGRAPGRAKQTRRNVARERYCAGDVAGDVEIVRHYYKVLDSVLERYWTAPGVSFTGSPLVNEVLALLDRDAEWASVIREEPFRGREEALRGVGLARRG